MADLLSKLKILLPGRLKPKGTAVTPGYNPDNAGELIPLPAYRQHLTDILSQRQQLNSQQLLQQIVESDPDASSALNAYLTVADVAPTVRVVDLEGQLDRDGHKLLNEIVENLEVRRDYTKGFQLKPSIRSLAESLRYMLLVRGGIAVEAVYGLMLELVEFRIVDLGTIQWMEKQPGLLVPYQQMGSGDPVALDIPTFFVNFYRKPPTSKYPVGAFVSAINTIAARQQVINDLYRIMQLTGFPRIDIEMVEEVIAKNAPANVRSNPQELRQYLAARRGEVLAQFNGIRADQPVVHYDSAKVKMLNDKNPAAGLNVESIIAALNAQNQAGLRTMATVLGRGESGVNTATVEASLFALNAGSLNKPIGELLSAILTQALRLQGSESRVVVEYPQIELRSDFELEAQKTLRTQRLRQDLSDGLITDDEYHLWMYGRLRPEAVEEMSGTGFMSGGAVEVDAKKVSPNSDPMGRSVSRASDKAAKSNTKNQRKK